MARLNFDLREDIHAEFRRHCKAEGRSLSDVVRSLIMDWNRAKREEAYHKKMLERGERDGN